jgi:P27 family predicted phage terminase small subunit
MPADVPEPPAALGKEATAEWRWIAKELHHAGILTKLDRPALIAYCWSYGLWSQAERILAAMAAADPVTSGLVIYTSNGNLIQNPIVGIANKALADMVRYAVELGMTPRARARLEAVKPPRPADRSRRYF